MGLFERNRNKMYLYVYTLLSLILFYFTKIKYFYLLLSPYEKYRNVKNLYEILYFCVCIFSVLIEIEVTQVQCIFLLLKLSSTAIQSMYHIFDVTGLEAGECEWML